MNHAWFVMLIPACFLILLVVMLVWMHRDLKRMAREREAAMREIEASFARIRTQTYIIHELNRGLKVEGKIVEIGNGYFVIEKDGKQTTIAIGEKITIH